MSQGAGPGQARADYPPEPYAWFVVALLFLLAILAYTDRYVLTLLVDPIRRTFRVSDLQVSLLLGLAFALVYGGLGVVLGTLADRLNRRNLIVFGILIWSVSTIACGLSSSYGALFLSRMGVGLGEAGLTPAAISLISDYFAPERRGSAVGCYLIAVPLGGGLANIIGGAVLAAVSHGALHPLVSLCGAPWRATLVLLGAPGLVLALALVFIKEVRRQEDVPSAPLSGASPRSQARIWGGVVPMLAAVAGVSLAVACVVAWGPSVFVRKFHAPAGLVGLRVGLSFSLGGSLGVLLGGVLGDRARASAGPRARLWLCLAGAGIAAPCAAFGLAAGPLTALVALTAFTCASDMAISSGISSLLDAVPNRQRGRATSLTFFLNVAVGAGLGPTLVALVNASGSKTAGGLGPSILAVTTPVFVLVILLFAIALRASPARGSSPRRG